MAGPPRILIAEDESGIADTLCYALTSDGFAPVWCRTAEETLAQLDDHFDQITASAYSVSLFTNWRGASFNQVWLKRRVTDEAAYEPEAQ